jgi:ABC-2 type transport system ATP-binding protein
MIDLTEVTKVYRGPLGLPTRAAVRALDGVSLRVPAGSALGVVGLNGAGKSTLLRLLLGYLRPTSGTLRVAGMAPRAFVERHGIGYVPERPAIPPRWTARRALQAFAALGDVEPWRERVETTMGELGLDAVADRRVDALSKGNLQRLALGQALLGDRRVLILDEPTDGVDPEWTARVRDVLQRWRAADPDRVLLFASHNLDEVERIAERVAVLAEGRLREMLELRAATTTLPPYRLEIEDAPGSAAAEVQRLFPGAAPAGTAGGSTQVWHVAAPDLAELNRRLALLLGQGVVVRALTPEHPSLEQRFRRSMRGSA